MCSEPLSESLLELLVDLWVDERRSSTLLTRWNELVAPPVVLHTRAKFIYLFIYLFT